MKKHATSITNQPVLWIRLFLTNMAAAHFTIQIFSIPTFQAEKLDFLFHGFGTSLTGVIRVRRGVGKDESML